MGGLKRKLAGESAGVDITRKKRVEADKEILEYYIGTTYVSFLQRGKAKSLKQVSARATYRLHAR